MIVLNAGIYGTPQFAPAAGPRTLFSESFPYLTGALGVVSSGRWALENGSAGVVNVQAGTPGLAFAASGNPRFVAGDTLAALDLTKQYSFSAQISVNTNGAAGLSFEQGPNGAGLAGAIQVEINGLVNPCIVRAFNGAGGNSGNFSLGVAGGTFQLAAVVYPVTRTIAVSINGVAKFTYQLAAATGNKIAAIAFTPNSGALTSITNIRLTQP